MMKLRYFMPVFLILLVGLVSAEAFSNSGSSSSSGLGYQYTNPSISGMYSSSDIASYWPQMAKEMEEGQCAGNTDFMVIIPPMGCTPSVVRSDLLDDQNVPVFCQLESLKVNPLIKVSAIKSISFKGKYPSEIAGVSFYPSRAALRSYTTLLGSPIVNNIGYVVIVLKKQNNESSMAKNVSGNLTATMYYDATNAFGVGNSEFYLRTINDIDWESDWVTQTFWGGRGILRLKDVQNDEATVEVLSGEKNVIRTVKLKLGETSSSFYFPGFYCQAGLKLKLNSVIAPEDSVVLNVDGSITEVRKGSNILNTGCRVTNLNVVSGNVGSVKISCNGKTFDLSLSNAYKALFNGVAYNVSDFVANSKIKDEKLYLAYAGFTKKTIKTDNSAIAPGAGFSVLFSDSSYIDKKIYADLSNKINSVFSSHNVEISKDDFVKQISVGKYEGQKMIVLFDGESDFVKFEGIVDATNTAQKISDFSQDSRIGKYFDEGDKAVSDLVKLYPQEREADGKATYSEDALMEEINLINSLQQNNVDYSAKKIDLMNKFLELYPDSTRASYVRQQLVMAGTTNSLNAYKTVYSNNDYHTIGLERFKPVDAKAKTFQLNVDNINAVNEINKVDLSEGDTINLSKIIGAAKTENEYLIIKKIDANQIDVDLYTTKTTTGSSGKLTYSTSFVGTYHLPHGEDAGGNYKTQNIPRGSKGNSYYNLYVSDISVDKVAYVSIVSDLKTSSEANFTFNIGIEKRAIQLNPEKAVEQADELNKTIQKWEEKNAKLGDLVEKWKGVCLATGLGLQIKNLLTGYSGESLARQKVMMVYRSKCTTNTVDSTTGEKYPTVDACYNHYSDEIEKDVAAYTKAIEDINTEVKDKTLDQWKADSSCTMTLTNGATVSTSSFQSWEDVKACLVYNKLKGTVSSDLETSLKQNADIELKPAADAAKTSAQISDLKNELPSGLKDTYVNLQSTNYNIPSDYVKMTISTVKGFIDGDTNSAAYKTIMGQKDDDMVGVVTTKENTQWKLIIVRYADGSPKTDGIFNFVPNANKITVSGESTNTLTQEKNAIKVGVSSNNAAKCVFNYTNPNIKFYETDPNKGMPAVVPIDLQRGWYVYVPQSQGGLISNSVQGYQASGAVQFYYLCNVGPNGREDMRAGDDICQSFNINNYDNVEAFTGCSLPKSEIQSLARNAEDAIRQAARGYGNGVRSISINGKTIPVEAGLTSDSATFQCQDFMSADDCKLMYNVCDPVICPTSRCNFGGQMPVANVIQSGIVGSMVLCLKNFVLLGGDVYVPVCLTGLHAGIEGYVSILKAQQSCLKEYSKSGKHVGICDEMTAVYKCEFFWRQVAPLTQSLIPSLANFAYTGSFNKKAGGGEYATFQASWDNMQKSVDYFKNTYASTSFTAFKFGDVQSLGTEFCRNFIGTSTPTSGAAIDALLKPESPPQFYGKFSEIPLTEATVPATSQYKVYYHIYAGTDLGLRYTIYLKNPPATSYYQTAQTILVKQGYVAVGEQVDETTDFTSPKGYKELCIIINDQEQCGFGSISTDFSINAVSDMYAQQQGAQTNITTEKECIQGTPSVLALANTNIEAGAQNAINPDISLSGINRVCATVNPGNGTNSVRWKAVGYCGDKKLICWLDNESLRGDTIKVLKNMGSISGAEQVLSNSEVATIINTPQINAQNLEKLKGAIGGLAFSQDELFNNDLMNNKIVAIVAIADGIVGGESAMSADVLLWKYRLYDRVVRLITGSQASRSSGAGLAAAPPSAAVSAPSAPASTTDSVSSKGILLIPKGKDFKILVVGTSEEFVLQYAGTIGYRLMSPKLKVLDIVTINSAISIPSGSEGYSYFNGCIFNGKSLNCPVGGGSNPTTAPTPKTKEIINCDGNSYEDECVIFFGDYANLESATGLESTVGHNIYGMSSKAYLGISNCNGDSCYLVKNTCVSNAHGLNYVKCSSCSDGVCSG